MLVGKPHDRYTRLLSHVVTSPTPTTQWRATIGCVHDRPHALRRIMPDLPSGTVTFLFTDIEGSTALWERDRAATRVAVERHLAILRSTIEAHHGVLYKRIGDGTQAAFPTAEDGLRAAVDAQRALVAEPWSDPPGHLRVRMALHVGEAVAQDGDYLAAP